MSDWKKAKKIVKSSFIPVSWCYGIFFSYFASSWAFWLIHVPRTSKIGDDKIRPSSVYLLPTRSKIVKQNSHMTEGVGNPSLIVIFCSAEYSLQYCLLRSECKYSSKLRNQSFKVPPTPDSNPITYPEFKYDQIHHAAVSDYNS